MLVITHYPRLLDYVVPDRVHVLTDGRIIRSGDHHLASQLEAHGYGAEQPVCPGWHAMTAAAALLERLAPDPPRRPGEPNSARARCEARHG